MFLLNLKKKDDFIKKNIKNSGLKICIILLFNDFIYLFIIQIMVIQLKFAF